MRHYLRTCFYLILILLFSSCTIPIENFITNKTNSDLWFVYIPNEDYGEYFGDSESQRFKINVDSAYSVKQLKKGIKTIPLKRNNYQSKRSIHIKLNTQETTHLGSLPHWTNPTDLVNDLKIRIVNNENQEIITDLTNRFVIKDGITEIIIE